MTNRNFKKKKKKILNEIKNPFERRKTEENPRRSRLPISVKGSKDPGSVVCREDNRKRDRRVKG